MCYKLTLTDAGEFRALSLRDRTYIILLFSLIRFYQEKGTKRGLPLKGKFCLRESTILNQHLHFQMTEEGLVYFAGDKKVYTLSFSQLGVDVIQRPVVGYLAEDIKIADLPEDIEGMVTEGVAELNRSRELFQFPFGVGLDTLPLKRFDDNERPQGCCYDCGLKYGTFPDFSITNEHWELINPTHHEGAGILCPTCIAVRLNCIELWYGHYNQPLGV